MSEEEREYREMMRLTKEWMDYDPDAMPESYPAPWETHVKTLMEEGPWPCWDPSLPESHFEPEPEYVPFVEAPGAYSKFDDKAKIYENQLKAERAELTAKRQAEIRERPWMSMDGDLRLKDIRAATRRGGATPRYWSSSTTPTTSARRWRNTPCSCTTRGSRSITGGSRPRSRTRGSSSSPSGTPSPRTGAENCDALAEEYGIPQRITDSRAMGGGAPQQSQRTKTRARIDIGEEDEDEDDEEDEDEDEDEEK